MVRTVSGVSTGPRDGQHRRAALGCGATITETEADVAAGLEILAAIRRAQIELGGCKVLRRSPPICGCCLVLWRRCCFRVPRQLVFHRDADDSHRGGWREVAESHARCGFKQPILLVFPVFRA